MLLALVYRRVGNWGSEILSKVAEVTQLGSVESKIKHRSVWFQGLWTSTSLYLTLQSSFARENSEK